MCVRVSDTVCSWWSFVRSIHRTPPTHTTSLELSTMAKKNATTTAVPSDNYRLADGSLKPIAQRVQESAAAAAAANYPTATAEQVAAAAARIVKVEQRGGTPDAFGGRPGSIAAAHNTLFLSLPHCKLSAATVRGVVESIEFQTCSGVVREGKYNPCHMQQLPSEVRTHNMPALARTPDGYYCLNPLWLANYTKTTGVVLANVGSEPIDRTPATRKG